MNNGFYTALGTPLDEMGNVMASSMAMHVEDQINAGVSGLLVMGSMGKQATIKNTEFVKTAHIATTAAKGKCPVFVGVMDNSIHRVLDRIESLAGLKLDGVVATMPFYSKLKQAEIEKFFEALAASSPFPVYMYDLPGVTQINIEQSTAKNLMKMTNIAGIKTGNLELARTLHRTLAESDLDFEVFFSGLDVFDVAYGYGLTKQLDGMFACTTPIASKMYKSLEHGDLATASQCLDEIVQLRDLFVSVGLSKAFSYAMNLLGFPGIFCPDYATELNNEGKAIVEAEMQRLHLI